MQVSVFLQYNYPIIKRIETLCQKINPEIFDAHYEYYFMQDNAG